MKYRTLKLELRYAPERLNRTFYVREDIPLSRLASAILSSVKADGGHLFEFIAQNKDSYGLSYGEPDYLLSEGTLEDLGERFRFIYDFGDGWEFDCRLLKREKEIYSDKDILFAEGKGLGIWEDDIQTFFAYLSGEAAPDMTADTEDDDAGFYMPENLPMEKLSDFDQPLDPETEQNRIDDGAFSLIEADEDDDEDEDDDDFYDPDDGIWAVYSDLVDDALGAYDDHGEGWLAAYREFKNVCETLKQENRLPDNFSDLVDIEGGDYCGVSFITDNLPDDLEEAERYEECLDIIHELKGMFFFEDEELNNLNLSEYRCLVKARGAADALAFAEAWIRQMPNSWPAKSCYVNGMARAKKMKDAEAFLKKELTDDLECNAETYGFFMAAEDFYAVRGNKAKARKLHEMIEEEDRRQEEEMMRDFDDEWDDDEDPDDEIDASWSHRDLYHLICIFKNSPDDESYTMAALSAAKLAYEDRKLCFIANDFDKKGRLQLETMDYDGEKFLIAYSMEEIAPDEFNTVLLYADSVIDNLKESRFGGLCIDPDETGALLVPTDMLIQMRDLFETNDPEGLYEDDDDDELNF